MPDSLMLRQLYAQLGTSFDGSSLRELASWHADQGERDIAECLVWLAGRQRWPFCYRSGQGMKVTCAGWNEGWYWWGRLEESYGADWGHPESCRLPDELWQRLPHTRDYEPIVFKEYPSLLTALEALQTAWSGLSGTLRERVRTDREP